MNNKTVFLTGSTSGIGRATSLELVKFVSVLILPVRNMSKGEELKKELAIINPACQIDLYNCNLESIESVKCCANLILKKYKVIDILINNAGVLDYQCRFTVDGIESHFQVNVLSQYIFNTILKPLVIVSEQGRIVNVSGLAEKFGKFNIDKIQVYSNKKSIFKAYSLIFDSLLYRNMSTFGLAKELENTDVAVNCLHPGTIKTNIARDGVNLGGQILNSFANLFSKSPEHGAKTTLYLALSDSVAKEAGKFWSDCNIAKSSDLSLDMELAHQLKTKCHELTGI
jgi:short-subunit dehydrogenase